MPGIHLMYTLVIAADIVSDIALNNTVHYLLGSVKAL
jgi:hypothetical protein